MTYITDRKSELNYLYNLLPIKHIQADTQRSLLFQAVASRHKRVLPNRQRFSWSRHDGPYQFYRMANIHEKWMTMKIPSHHDVCIEAADERRIAPKGVSKLTATIVMKHIPRITFIHYFHYSPCRHCSELITRYRMFPDRSHVSLTVDAAARQSQDIPGTIDTFPFFNYDFTSAKREITFINISDTSLKQQRLNLVRLHPIHHCY